MIKKILFFSILSLFSVNSNAQSNPKNPIVTGVKGGVSFVNLSAGKDSQKMKPAFHAGGFIEFPLSYYRQFAFQVELQYSNQGYKGKEIELRDKTSGKILETNKLDDVTLHYLNLPLMFKYYVNENFTFEVGPQLGFLMDAKGEFDLNKYNPSREYLNNSSSTLEEAIYASGYQSRDYKKYYEKMDFGISAGISYIFDNGMFISGRYYLGLKDVYKADNGYTKIPILPEMPEQLINQINELNKDLDFQKAKNTMIQISVGYRF